MTKSMLSVVRKTAITERRNFHPDGAGGEWVDEWEVSQ